MPYFIAHSIIPNTVDECAAFDLTPIIALKPVITATLVIHHALQHLFWCHKLNHAANLQTSLCHSPRGNMDVIKCICLHITYLDEFVCLVHHATA